MSDSSKAINKQELFKALMLADSLEKIPGGRLISIMKMKTDPDTFVQGVNYISKKVWEAFLANCPQEILDQLDKLLQEGKDEKYQEFLASVILVNQDLAQIVANAMDFYGNSYARVKKIDLQLD
jgi:hypothetical protein